jgi:hypothetical protein
VSNNPNSNEIKYVLSQGQDQGYELGYYSRIGDICQVNVNMKIICYGYWEKRVRKCVFDGKRAAFSVADKYTFSAFGSWGTVLIRSTSERRRFIVL